MVTRGWAASEFLTRASTFNMTPNGEHQIIGPDRSQIFDARVANVKTLIAACITYSKFAVKTKDRPSVGQGKRCTRRPAPQDPSLRHVDTVHVVHNARPTGSAHAQECVKQTRCILTHGARCSQSALNKLAEFFSAVFGETSKFNADNADLGQIKSWRHPSGNCPIQFDQDAPRRTVRTKLHI